MSSLGIDYGQKHIGLALASTPLAEPLESTTVENAAKKISEFIKKYTITDIIIGCPDEKRREEVEAFIASLNTSAHVTIVDETLSSHDAREALAHTTQSRRHENEHSVAATILLQNWLDTHS